MSGSVLKLLPTLSQQNSRQHAKVGMLNRPQAKPAEAPLPLRAVFALECGIRAAVIVIALRAGYAAQRRQRDRGGKHSLPKPAFSSSSSRASDGAELLVLTRALPAY
jgi:hypothetical protein